MDRELEFEAVDDILTSYINLNNSIFFHQKKKKNKNGTNFVLLLFTTNI